MNRKKLEDYSLTGSIHTLAVKSEGLVEDVQDTVADCITISSRVTDEGRVTTSIINPNKLTGDVFTYREFDTVFQTILAGAGIDSYDIVRADMRFDSYDSEHYKAYSKLNRYLISALALSYKTRNCYRSTNLFTQQQLSIAIKNDKFEIENYDKDAESNGMDAAQSRLEERSKRWKSNDLRSEFVEHWFIRWDKAIKHLDEVQRRYNDELVKLYMEGKDAYPRKFRSLTDFLIQYQDCIFCKRQLVDLLSRIPEIGPDKALNRAENHKKRYGCEFFSKSDIKRAIAEIKRATLAFYDS